MPPKRKALQQDSKPCRSRRKLSERPYTYETLLPGEIRVLILSPGQLSDPLCGTLETVSLQDAPTYKAISYAWGEPVFPERINLVRGVLGITTSLHGALCRFRSETEPIRLWADAICINQKGHQEKNHQVDRMGDIYSLADEVLVWLGEAQSSDCLAFWMLNFLDDFATARRDKDEPVFNLFRIGGLPEAFEDFKITSDSSFRCPSCEARSIQESPTLEKALAALATVWRRSWFQRLWVLQEVILVTSAKFFFGNHDASRESMEDVAIVHYCHLFYSHQIWACPSEDRKAVESAYELFNSMQPSNDLCHVLVKTFKLSCSQPRDRVFATRALAGVQYAEELAPDYAAPLTDVWTRAANYILSGPSLWEKYPELSCACPSLVLALPAIAISNMSRDLPSWVPDFSSFTAESERKRTFYTLYSRNFSAGGTALFAVNFDTSQ